MVWAKDQVSGSVKFKLDCETKIMIICLVKMFSYRIDNSTKVHICLGEDRMIGYVPTRLCFGSGLGLLPAIIEFKFGKST